ncbi:MAG: tripartite tricarboxylate transporter TctB family protein [Spirochaetales bacterium]|jgi:hypothetical protein|nr:tripartite tricarboxylate transporter TctB family protein [Spirochaetales bacterium]
MRIKTLIPLASTAVGIFWVSYGLIRHGFWDELKGPQPGFVPVLMASLLTLASVLGLIQSFREKDNPDTKESWTIVLAAALIFTCVFLVGMIPSLLIFVFVWLKLYEKTSWKDTITVLVISFAIAFGVFVVWLGVPFPNGVLVDTLMYL